jgi:hypothetical protein
MNAPEIDTDEQQYPSQASRPQPTLGDTFIAWVQLAGGTAVANIAILFVALALGAEMTVDVGLFEQEVGAVPIVTLTLLTLFISTFFWSLVAFRVPAFAHLWVPIGWGMGILSLGGILGAAGITTGLALGAMHVLTTAVACHLIPRRLPR